MASRISNLELLNKCKEQIVADPTRESMDPVIKNAIVSASRQIFSLEAKPMAWARGSYDNLFTRSSAEITAVTQADPGVFTAESLDTDITGHGYTDDDVVYLDGLSDDSMDELNKRFFRLHRVSATTFYLHTMDGQDNIDTSGLDAWSSGGYIYHCGVKIPTSSFVPSSSTGNRWERWTLEDIYDVTFDSIPSYPISESEEVSHWEHMRPGAQPGRWRYWRNDYQGFDPANSEHFLIFTPTSQDYNIRIFYKKGYPDISEWTDKAYPPHPPEIHDCIWRRALSLLATNAEKQRRESKDGRLMGKIEILYAQHWQNEAAKDENFIRDVNRRMQGQRISNRGLSA